MTARLRFEDIPTELLYEIQSYLNAVDLFQAFSHLNSRFDRLLASVTNLHFEVRKPVDNQRSTTVTFASRITSLNIPADSDSVAIATVFPNVRSITFHRAIRLSPSTLPTVEHITLDLSAMRPKYAVHLCSSILSSSFPCLSSFHLVHRKASVVGHWNPLTHSVRHPCPTLTVFVFDLRPTVDWAMLERFLPCMPHLHQLTVRTFNTRARWTLERIARTLRTSVPHLTRLYIRINSPGVRTPLVDDASNHALHPLFKRIASKAGNSRKSFITTIISSAAR